MKKCLLFFFIFYSSISISQVRTRCATWVNGLDQDFDVVNAVDHLCEQNLIPDIIDINSFQSFKIKQAAFFTVYALYQGIPTILPSDNYPTFFGDIEELTSIEYQAIKAMCFLEYGDGRSCFPREFTSIQPSNAISPGYILRMLYEAYNIPPDMTGFNAYDHGASPFLSYISRNDYNYGYYKKAFDDGFLEKYISSGQLFSQKIIPGEFYFYMLDAINNKYSYQRPQITPSSFYTPNNIQLTNSNQKTDITKAIFKTYEQNAFSLPSGGLGLNFIFSYHSDWLDIPILGFSNTNTTNQDINPNYIDLRAKQKNFPLGLGWTHSYNIFAQSILDSRGKDKLLVIHWGDGSITVYNTATAQFETKGVYDFFAITDTRDGRITAFTIKNKDQIVTAFNSAQTVNGNQVFPGTPLFYQAVSITDQNANSVHLYYEDADCNTDPAKCYGTSNRRLQRVTDSFGGRSLLFNYQQGTDLLESVTDNQSRTIEFTVNKNTLNLDAATNAKKAVTKYIYGMSDIDNHMLLSIERPEGNKITNSYFQRKLQQTQTNDYVASVSFTPSYNPFVTSTQTTINTSPRSGQQYSITYNHNSSGAISNITSATTNISFTYGDTRNPNLPTAIVDNNTNIRQSLQYDATGNILQSDYSGGGITQTHQYTYDSQNHPITYTWPNGTVLNYTYDENGRQTGEYAGSYKLEHTYNPNGTLAFERDAIGRTKNFNYDKYGNQSSLLWGNTRVQYSANYDDVSRLTSLIDANNVETRCSYDSNDNLTSMIVDPASLNIKTSYSYDKNDNVKVITSPTNISTTLSYDSNDNVIRQQTDKAPTKLWGYNGDGTIQSYTDKKGNSFSYQYFPSGDPNEGKLKSNGIQNYTYDNNSRLSTSVSTINQSNGTITYGYDPLLRHNNIQFSSPSFSTGVSYSYDISGNITQINLTSEGKSIFYEYDPLNRLQTIKDWNKRAIVSYSYLDNGLLNQEVFRNGAVVRYHYDDANRVDSIYSLKSDMQTLIHAVGATLDNNGNHLRESYYVNWTGQPGNTYFEQKSLTFKNDQKTDWIQSVNNQSVSNDLNGNVTSNPYSSFLNATYDPHNNLLNSTLDGKQRAFSYDPLEARYANDSLFYIVDHVNNNNVLGIRKRDANTAERFFVYSPYGLVCSLDPQTAMPTYYLYDFRGSTVGLVDANQNTIDYYKYDPWGNISEASSSPGKSTPFLFVGKYGVMYESPHLYYMRARYYDPTNGRFLGEDPEWNTNLFAYAGNNPITQIDPLGKNFLSIFNEGLANVGEVLEKVGLVQMGLNGRIYTPGISGRVFLGNQYTSTIPLANTGKALSRLSYVGYLGYVLNIYEGYTIDGQRYGPNTQKALRSAAGNFIGSSSGAAIGAGQGAIYGAAIGVWFFGVGEFPGALIGSIVGGVIGGYGGGYIGEKVANF